MFRQNVLEGMLADPSYGGNKDMVGWKWVGFPGDPMRRGDPYEQYIFTQEAVPVRGEAAAADAEGRFRGNDERRRRNGKPPANAETTGATMDMKMGEAEMANKKADVAIVGVGWVGGILAAELTKAGLEVVGLERGHDRSVSDFTDDHDELRYAIRYELFQNAANETWTLRHNMQENALPMRQLGSFLPGTGIGGPGCTGTAKRGASIRATSRSAPARSTATARRRSRPG